MFVSPPRAQHTPSHPTFPPAGYMCPGHPGHPGAEPGWSQVCWWLNHDLHGRGKVKSCTPVSQLAGWEGEDLALKPLYSQEPCQELGMRGNPDGFPVTTRVCRKPCGHDRTPHPLSIQLSLWPLTLLGAAVLLPKRSIAAG